MGEIYHYVRALLLLREIFCNSRFSYPPCTLKKDCIIICIFSFPADKLILGFPFEVLIHSLLSCLWRSNSSGLITPFWWNSSWFIFGSWWDSSRFIWHIRWNSSRFWIPKLSWGWTEMGCSYVIGNANTFAMATPHRLCPPSYRKRLNLLFCAFQLYFSSCCRFSFLVKE